MRLGRTPQRTWSQEIRRWLKWILSSPVYPAKRRKNGASTFERADERTRTADLVSLRVISQTLQGFARTCKSRISKPDSILWFALCCTVPRSRWCQSGVRNPQSIRRKVPLKQICDYCSIIPFAEGLGRCVLRSSYSPDPIGMSIPYSNRQLLQVTLRLDALRIDDDCISMNTESSQPIFVDQGVDAE